MFKYLKRADISEKKKKTEIPRCIANRFYKGKKNLSKQTSTVWQHKFKEWGILLISF